MCLLFHLKITNILKLSGWGLQKIELPWEQIFIAVGVFSVKLFRVPNFNGLPCKLAKIFMM